MKKLHTTNERKKFNRIKENKRKNRKKKSNKRQLQQENIGTPITSLKKKEIKFPENLELLQNYKEIEKIINTAIKLINNNKYVALSFENVSITDTSTLMYLVSVFYKYPQKRHFISFISPLSNDVDTFISDSGFHQYTSKEGAGIDVHDSIGEMFQILAYENRSIELIEQIYKFINSKFPSINKDTIVDCMTVLTEIMDNTAEHAGEQNSSEKWWLSVFYNNNLKAFQFVFMDHGKGIMNTIEDKKKYIGLISYNASEKLKMILKNEANLSRTKEQHRGRGLPTINKILNDGNIQNLRIFANNILAEPQKDEYIEKNIPFNGTYYYWEFNG